MGVPGNNYNLKYKTSEERKEVSKKLCEHLRKGLSLHCFGPLSKNAISNYIERYPEDMNPSAIDEAYREGLMAFEELGTNAAKGHVPDFNSAAYRMIMQNKFQWVERSKTESEVTVKPIEVVERTVVKSIEPVKEALEHITDSES